MTAKRKTYTSPINAEDLESVRREAAHLLGSRRELLDDLVSDACLRLVRKGRLPKADKVYRFRVVRMLVRRAMLDLYRRLDPLPRHTRQALKAGKTLTYAQRMSARHPVYLEDVDPFNQIADESVRPQTDLTPYLRRLMRHNYNQWYAVVAYHLDGQTGSKIGRALGLSEARVSPLRRAGLNYLRQLVERENRTGSPDPLLR